MTSKNRGITLLLLAVLLWGPNPVITVVTLQQIPPLSLGFFRLAFAAVIAAVFFIPRGYLRIQRKDIPVFILIGLFGSSLNMAFFLFGLQHTTAMTAQAIFTATPVFTAIFAYLILKERIQLVQVIGVAIGLAGSLFIALRAFFETGNFEDGSLFGNGLIFVSLLMWVAYILISKNLSERYSPFTLTGFVFIFGGLSFIPLAVWENMQIGIDWVDAVTLGGVLGVVYQGAVASFIAFIAYQIGLQLTTAFAAGVVLYLGPVVTTAFAVPVLGETITWPFVIGVLLIISGSFVATQHEFVVRKLRKKQG